MRFLGFVLIAVGILTIGALFAGMDTGHNIRTITVGVTMISFGTTLAKPGLKARNTGVAQSGYVQSGYTSEGDLALPMTPPVAAILNRIVARLNRILMIVGGGGFALGLIVGVIIYLANSPREAWFFLIPAGLGSGIAWLMLMIWIFLTARGRRDLREMTYLRTSGPIRVDSALVPGGGGTTCLLRLVGHTFGIDQAIVPKLRGLDWACVDHSRHLHFIFEIRDRMGQIVHRAEGYGASPAGSSTSNRR